MAQQSNYTVENGSGSVVRADINNILAAINSSNSGASAPASAVPGSLWFDTSVSPATLKKRNAANTAWVEVSPDTIPANSLRGNSTGSAAAETNVTVAQLKTMLGYSTSFGTNSYTVTPDGTIIQYGRSVFTTQNNPVGSVATLGNVTFPLTFPVACRVFIAQPTSEGSTGNEHWENVLGTNTVTTSTGNIYHYRLSGAQAGGEQIGVRWIAIGN